MSLGNWEELGWIEVDAAGVAFCRDESGLSGAHSESTRIVEDGAVYQATMEDCPLPVEVRRDETGSIVEARMCFTNDVDVIEGTWADIGRMDLADGSCIACDPYCDGEQYRLRFEMKPGRYVAKVFERPLSEGAVDVLGLGISWAEPIEGKGSSDAAVE